MFIVLIALILVNQITEYVYIYKGAAPVIGAAPFYMIE